MKLENMKSKSGRNVPNQFIVQTANGLFFQSYNSVIAHKALNGAITLGPNWDYSNTTSKYRSIFLGESTVETRRKVESGEYLIADLDYA